MSGLALLGDGKQIAVTGAGVIAPGANGVEALWSLIAEANATQAETCGELAGLPTDFACAVSLEGAFGGTAPREARRWDRATLLAVLAAREAVAQAAPDLVLLENAAVIAGVGMGGVATMLDGVERVRSGRHATLNPFTISQLLPSAPAAELARALGTMGPVHGMNGACASGALAIAAGARLLVLGEADVAIVGGTEAAIHPMPVVGFGRMGALSRRCEDPSAASRPFDAGRDGFVIAEGAAFLVLQRRQDVHGPVLGLLASAGESCDAYHEVKPDPDGSGAVHAMRAAIAAAGLMPDAIAAVNTHGTSTSLNDQSEAFALRRVFGNDVPPLTASKAVTGHALGAAGAIEAVIALEMVRRGICPATANLEELDPTLGLPSSCFGTGPISGPVLSNSFGFGGINSSLVFTGAN